MYNEYIKRILDVDLSGIALIILSPVYLIISVLIAVFMDNPILFAQERIGRNEMPFKLYKFRSMTNRTDRNGNLLSEDKRLTRFGKFLRSSSLDELPELWSIFIGKMSLVGPRPMPTYYGPYFFDEERKRHYVRGGLIPPDSLSLKTMTTYEEQFKYEVEYVEKLTFMLDIKIIITTLVILFNRVRNDYGSDFRPHLNVYRSFLTSKTKI